MEIHCTMIRWEEAMDFRYFLSVKKQNSKQLRKYTYFPWVNNAMVNPTWVLVCLVEIPFHVKLVPK